MACTLVLIRHAKTEPTASGPGGDHARELLPRGRADAAALAQELAAAGLAPDLALVSTAARARQTLAGMLEELGLELDADVEVWPTRRIYDGGLDGVLEAVREVPEGTEVAWVVGHEPVMSTTAHDLTDPDHPGSPERDDLAAGLPTAAAAVLELDVPWEEAGLECARLTAVLRGRG